MSIITQVFERMRSAKMSLVFLGLAGVLVLVVFLFLVQTFFVSPESDDVASPSGSDALIETEPSSELDTLAGTLPEYSEEELERQYRELDAEFSKTGESYEN